MLSYEIKDKYYIEKDEEILCESKVFIMSHKGGF